MKKVGEGIQRKKRTITDKKEEGEAIMQHQNTQ